MIKVVLADDEKKVVLLLQKLIDWEKQGFEIVGIANDGIHALELVREKQPQLLITDIRMPGCDGIELIRQARELQPGIHFVVISGYRQFEYAQNALKYGVEDYLLKPLKKDDLNGILLRVREKLGEEAELEYQLKKSDDQRQRMLLSLLKSAIDRQQVFLRADQANDEFGFHFAEGSYCSVLIKPDISDVESHSDAFHILIRHALEIVRREIVTISAESAAAVWNEGIAVVLNAAEYQMVEVKQCFTRIRKEIEKQRDLFWDIRIAVFVGSARPSLEQMTESMREAVQGPHLQKSDVAFCGVRADLFFSAVPDGFRAEKTVSGGCGVSERGSVRTRAHGEFPQAAEGQTAERSDGGRLVPRGRQRLCVRHGGKPKRG